MHKSPWTWGWLNFYLLLKSKVFLYSSWGSHSKYTVVVCHFLLQLTHWKSPWCWERLRTEGALGDEMVGWHHWCNGHELGQTLGDDEGQGGLMCCSPWACKELDTTRWLNSNICLFKKFIFNWKVIALQYYVGFYQTSTWISHSLYMS